MCSEELSRGRCSPQKKERRFGWRPGVEPSGAQAARAAIQSVHRDARGEHSLDGPGDAVAGWVVVGEPGGGESSSRVREVEAHRRDVVVAELQPPVSS
jgi:hypothetical protein